jgi:hypothetical protein
MGVKLGSHARRRIEILLQERVLKKMFGHKKEGVTHGLKMRTLVIIYTTCQIVLE